MFKCKVADLKSNLVFKPTKIGFDYARDNPISKCQVIDINGDYTWLKEFKILPCTGLKDSKGNDIYMGDIIEYQLDYDCIRSEYNFEGYAHVVFEDAMFTLNDRSPQPLESFGIGEVVGNIYERRPMILKCLTCRHTEGFNCAYSGDDIAFETAIACELYEKH